MSVDELKKLLKENLTISYSTESKGSECTYHEKHIITIYFGDELISSTEIEGLGIDH